MKLTKKKMVSLLVVGICLLLASCSKKNQEGGEKTTPDIVKAKKIELDQSYQEVQSIKRLSDGTVRLGVSDDNGANPRIYESKNQGESWEKTIDLASQLEITDQDYLRFILGENKEVFVQVIRGVQSYEEIFDKTSEYYTSTSGKEFRKIDISLDKMVESKEIHKNHRHDQEHVEENSLSTIDFTSDGNLIASDLAGNVLMIDSLTGEKLQKYVLAEDMGTVDDFFTDATYLYASSTRGFWVYDKKSGKLVADTKLEEIISTRLEKAFSTNKMISASLKKGIDSKKLVFTNGLGFFEYDETTEKVQKKIDLQQMDISLSDSFVTYPTLVSENSFLIAVNHFENKTQVAYLATRYSGEQAKKERADITRMTIWSLNEGSDLSRVIEGFRTKFPNTEISIEIGVDQKNAKNTSDAINQLNTKLLAGEGPDLILLDGLPIETYLEKDLLVDLSDVVDKDRVFKKIANTYQTQKGLLAIPYGFAFMNVAMPKNEKKQIDSITSFLAYLDQNEEAVVGIEDGKMLGSFFYYSTVEKWFDGQAIDKKQLKLYFEQFKRIYEKIDIYESENLEFYKEEQHFLSGNYFFLTEEVTKNGLDQSTISFDYIGATFNWYGLLQLSKKEIESSVFSGQKYVPKGILSVNKKSKSLKQAKEFVRYMFADDRVMYTAGLPTNKTLFAKEFQNERNSIGKDFDLLTEVDFQKAVENVERLDQPVNLNNMIAEAVMKELISYVMNNENSDVAVDNAAKKIELYLAE